MKLGQIPQICKQINIYIALKKHLITRIFRKKYRIPYKYVHFQNSVIYTTVLTGKNDKRMANKKKYLCHMMSNQNSQNCRTKKHLI